jgi:hypothetical protein
MAKRTDTRIKNKKDQTCSLTDMAVPENRNAM